MSNPFAASDALFAEDYRSLTTPSAPPSKSRSNSEDISLTSAQLPQYRYSYDTGDKWSGGFGRTEILLTDYWTLRQRSVQLFETNLYARGLIRRLITNEINTGLHLEARPEEKILGVPEDSLADWSENIENRFTIWESSPILCDQTERATWGALQAAARQEALIAGDVLVWLRQDPRTNLPRVQLIGGQNIQTPMNWLSSSGIPIRNGVETDSLGRHIAYHVRQSDGTSKRLPAFGEKSGRRLAWLIYGCDKKLEDTRGKPLLALILQTLKDIDRYRDSTIVKAGLNSMLAMFVTKTQDKVGTMPLSAGAVRIGSNAISQTHNDGSDRRYQTREFIPGLIIDELQVGEEPKAFQNNGVDEKFGDFEASLLSLIAWGNGIPPEILTLSFNSNYSASQAAINEFNMGIAVVRKDFGESLCQPVYQEWLVAETLAGKISAPGLLEAWRDSKQYDTFGAWTTANWSGNVKPAVDLSKRVGGFETMVANGFCTYTMAARELNGSKWSKNVQKLAREAKQLADAVAPLMAVQALTKPQPQDSNADPNAEPIDKESPADKSAANRAKLHILGQ